MDPLDKIDEGSQTPKYQQIINYILEDIEKGVLKLGDRIPSINETSIEYYLSRDTVEKAYNHLRERGIIASVRGKGFYIANTNINEQLKILLLFNKLSAYKKTIYYAFMESLTEIASIDLQIHHYNAKIFEKLIAENLGKYHYYVVMPHFFEYTDEIDVHSVFSQIPKEKLIFLDRDLPATDHAVGSVYQDFENDIFEALHSGIDLLEKYHKLILVFPRENRYTIEILQGFEKFCQDASFAYEIIDRVRGYNLNPGEAYLVIDETDLVDFIKSARIKGFKPGRDLGLISYNETPLKEILDNGITVISTDHEKMGATAANMILNKDFKRIKNPFYLIRRNTL